MSDVKCNTDEILKQLKVLDSLKQLRENMGNEFFAAEFPELNGLGGKLDKVIENQEEKLNGEMEACGSITSDELPTTEPLVETETLDGSMMKWSLPKSMRLNRKD
jgi:hypothetical protein